MGGPAEFISIAKDIATTIIAGLALYVAWQGLSTWRRQLRGNAQYEAARKLLVSCFKLRDAIEGVKAPLIHSMETAVALKETGTSIEGLNNRDSLRVQKSAVYEFRWRRVRNAQSELRVNSIEARALWGDEVEAAFREVGRYVQELWAAIVADIEFEADGVREDPKDLIARRKVLWPMAAKPEDDEYMAKLNGAIDRFEKMARPHLGFVRG